MNRKAVRFSPKLRPLFRLKTRYAVLIGGRAGGKSFGLASAMAVSTYDDGFNVLFCRYTLKSAEVSVIPEFLEKLDILESRDDFFVRRHDVVNKGTGSRIFFRGIKAGSKTQTAHLKSLHAVKMFVMDEAEEMVDEKEFDVIDDSLREKEADIHVILCLNQADVDHWIYRRFYKEPGLPDDFAGVHGDVTYIPITYLDNLHNLHPSFLEKIQKMKDADPEKYEHIYGLKWERIKVGRIYTDWKRDAAAMEMTRKGDCWYGIDWGFANDPTAVVRLWYDSDTGRLWVYELLYAKGLFLDEIAGCIRRDIIDMNYLYIHRDMPDEVKDIEDEERRREAEKKVIEDRERRAVSHSLMYCDPARPEHIAELRRTYNLNAVPGENMDKVGRVDWLKGCDVWYEGENVEAEYKTYSYVPMKEDMTLFTNVPKDGNDHAMDAINYGAVTHLRRQGIPNRRGEV